MPSQCGVYILARTLRRTKFQVSRLIRDEYPLPLVRDPEKLVGVAVQTIRDRFVEKQRVPLVIERVQGIDETLFSQHRGSIADACSIRSSCPTSVSQIPTVQWSSYWYP